MEILIKRLNEQAKLPAYCRETSPGVDLYTTEAVTIEPGAKVVVATGVALAMPVGYIGLVTDGDDDTLNRGLKTERGRVDSSYRDEVKIEVVNTGSEAVTFAAGDKVAEMLIQKVERPVLIEAEELS